MEKNANLTRLSFAYYNCNGLGNYLHDLCQLYIIKLRNIGTLIVFVKTIVYMYIYSVISSNIYILMN